MGHPIRDGAADGVRGEDIHFFFIQLQGVANLNRRECLFHLSQRLLVDIRNVHGATISQQMLHQMHANLASALNGNAQASEIIASQLFFYSGLNASEHAQ